jgi:hypothetical protein
MSRTFWRRSLCLSRIFWERSLFMSQSEHAVIGQSSRCPNKSQPDVYSIAVMTQSSSKVLTGQISHDKIYYGQMIKLQKSK